jgi:hypothetical protein
MSEKPPVTDFATDFDHTDPAWVADPYPIWQDLRERCPVAHTDRYGGAWFPATHAGVTTIAKDTENFTSRAVIMEEGRPGEEALPAPIGVAPLILWSRRFAKSVATFSTDLAVTKRSTPRGTTPGSSRPP